MINKALHTSALDLKVTAKELGAGLPTVRIVGPVTLWGADIVIARQNLSLFQDLIKETSRDTGERLSGYFTPTINDRVAFHMSRLPRRENLDVPSVASFQQVHSALSALLTKRKLEHISTEESPSANPEMRVLLGLEEGYFDQRRVDILAKISDGTFGSLEVARAAIESRIGNIASFGIDLDSHPTLESLKAVLAVTSFTTTHTVAEVRNILPVSLTVKAANIFAASADSLYQEPAAVIFGDLREEHFAAVCNVANKLHQARFSLEYLHLEEAMNVEILAHSNNEAASVS